MSFHILLHIVIKQAKYLAYEFAKDNVFINVMKKIILLVSSHSEISCQAEFPTFLNSQSLRKVCGHFRM